jgi:hypothetical protein
LDSLHGLIGTVIADVAVADQRVVIHRDECTIDTHVHGTRTETRPHWKEGH